MAQTDTRLLKHRGELPFDYVVEGNNLLSALLCYNWAVAGKSVAVILPHKPEPTGFRPTTAIYPSQWADIVTARQKLVWMERLRTAFPHLVLQQRVVNTMASESGLGVKDRLFNLLVAQNPKLKSARLALVKYPEYQLLTAAGWINGILSREYWVDTGQLAIELLLEAKKAGAWVLNSSCTADEAGVLLPAEDGGTPIVIKGKKVYRAVAPARKSISVEVSSEKSIGNPICFHDNDLKWQIRNLKTGELSVSLINREGQSKGVLLKEIERFRKIIPTVMSGELASPAATVKTVSRELFQDIIEEPEVDRIGGDAALLYKLQPMLPVEAECWNYRGYELHDVSTLADRLFDEARQTGIDKDYFLTLFYTYGCRTGEITEIAYSRPAGSDALPREHWVAAVAQYTDTIF